VSAYEYWRIRVQYTAGVWTDITADVDTFTAPINATNGTSAEVASDPAALSIVLHNPGFKYTPGNLLSSFALASGMPLEYSEIIAGQTIYLFTGTIEFPEIASVNLSMTQDQTLTVNAVDQLSRWERSPTFISTLGAHIMGSIDAGDLALYYPLNDESFPFTPAIGSGTLNPSVYGQVAPYTIASVAELVTVRDAAGPAGEDATFPIFTCPYFDPPVPTAGRKAIPHFKANISVHVGSTDTLVLAAWIRPATLVSALSPDLQDSAFLSISEDGTAPASSGTHGITFFDDVVGSAIAYFLENPNIATLTASASYPRDVWRLVTARITLATGACTLWIGSDVVVSGTLTGSPTSYDFLYLDLGAGYFGSVAHIQVYVGSNTFPYSEHLAQFALGLSGLERQSTGDRIKTIARYAGKTDADLTNVDSGGSIMQRATLAGLTVAGAMYDARDTEQGDLYVDGSGLLVFDDRRTLLNI
jgi:hypothetical protein